MEDVRGAVEVTIYGPLDEFDTMLAKLNEAGIPAQRDPYESKAIGAFFHAGTERPSGAFVEQCKERVREVVQGTDFRVDRAGVWDSNAASRQLPYNRHTGEWLEEFVDGEAPVWMREEQLQRLAERHGLSVADIELRDYITPPSA
jgi:hypothetical protein